MGRNEVTTETGTTDTCARCGAALLPNAAYCVWCGEAAIRGDRLDLAGSDARVAPRGKRVLAFGLDVAVVWGVQTTFNVLGLMLGFRIGIDQDRVDRYRACIRVATTPEQRSDCLSALIPHLGTILLLSLAIPFVIAMVYWAACNVRGVSIGKYAAGIRIVNGRGGRPGVARGLGRTAAAFFLSTPFFWLGYWWAFWQPQRRTWHDMIAGTYVVRVAPAPVLPPAPPAPPGEPSESASVRAL